jgi:hypothetical protein
MKASRSTVAAALVMVLAAIVGHTLACAPSSAPPAQQVAVGTWWDRTAPPRGGKVPQSRHYSIRSDLPAAQTKEYADHLDTMYDEYFRRLVKQAGLRQRSPEYPNVFMFASQQDYLDTLRTNFGINGTGSGGMFFIGPRGAGLAFWVEKLPKQRVGHVIQHEGFHQFANAFFGNDLPPWLNEGLAEFFGESVVEGKSVVIGQASPEVVTQVRTAVEKDKYLPFMDLLQMDSARWNGNVQSGNARLQYMQSWSMVHFLVYGENGKYEPYFSTMLKLLNAGTKPFDAWKKAFSLDTETEVLQFESRWKDYARAAKPGAYVAARNRLEFLANTDPRDSRSKFGIEESGKKTGGFEIRWQGRLGVEYRVLSTTNFQNWTEVPNTRRIGKGQWEAVTDSDSNGVKKFYRIEILQ